LRCCHGFFIKLLINWRFDNLSGSHHQIRDHTYLNTELSKTQPKEPNPSNLVPLAETSQSERNKDNNNIGEGRIVWETLRHLRWALP